MASSPPKRRRLFHRLRVLGLAVIALLIGARLALPYFVKRYVNEVLAHKIEGYRGSVQDVGISLWRGAYQLYGLKIFKLENKIPIPFIDFPQTDLSIAWRPVLKGHVVGKILLTGGALNFVDGPTAGQSQSGAEGTGWQDTFAKLFPLKMEQVKATDFRVHFLNLHSNPRVDVYLYDLGLFASNLSNIETDARGLPSRIAILSKVKNQGQLKLDASANIRVRPLAFDADFSLTGVDLRFFNDFLETYADFTVIKGRLDVFSEAASKNGQVKGYVKPLLTGVQILGPQMKKPKPQEVFPTIRASFVNFFLRRFPKDRVASKVPFSGPLEDPHFGAWDAFKNLVSNALVAPIKPRLDRDISIRSVSKVKEKHS